jgi:hypothetical protein
MRAIVLTQLKYGELVLSETYLVMDSDSGMATDKILEVRERFMELCEDIDEEDLDMYISEGRWANLDGDEVFFTWSDLKQ